MRSPVCLSAAVFVVISYISGITLAEGTVWGNEAYGETGHGAGVDSFEVEVDKSPTVADESSANSAAVAKPLLLDTRSPTRDLALAMQVSEQVSESLSPTRDLADVNQRKNPALNTSTLGLVDDRNFQTGQMYMNNPGVAGQFRATLASMFRYDSSPARYLVEIIDSTIDSPNKEKLNKAFTSFMARLAWKHKHGKAVEDGVEGDRNTYLQAKGARTHLRTIQKKLAELEIPASGRFDSQETVEVSRKEALRKARQARSNVRNAIIAFVRNYSDSDEFFMKESYGALPRWTDVVILMERTFGKLDVADIDVEEKSDDPEFVPYLSEMTSLMEALWARLDQKGGQEHEEGIVNAIKSAVDGLEKLTKAPSKLLSEYSVTLSKLGKPGQKALARSLATVLGLDAFNQLGIATAVMQKVRDNIKSRGETARECFRASLEKLLASASASKENWGTIVATINTLEHSSGEEWHGKDELSPDTLATLEHEGTRIEGLLTTQTFFLSSVSEFQGSRNVPHSPSGRTLGVELDKFEAAVGFLAATHEGSESV